MLLFSGLKTSRMISFSFNCTFLPLLQVLSMIASKKKKKKKITTCLTTQLNCRNSFRNYGTETHVESFLFNNYPCYVYSSCLTHYGKISFEYVYINYFLFTCSLYNIIINNIKRHLFTKFMA